MLIAPPANPRVYVGWSAIKQNWEAYWPTYAEYRVTMRVNKVNVSEPVAWVHGIETSHRRTKSGEVSSSHNYGTNIFVHRNDRWLMVLHQVVAIPEKHVTDWPFRDVLTVPFARQQSQDRMSALGQKRTFNRDVPI